MPTRFMRRITVTMLVLALALGGWDGNASAQSASSDQAAALHARILAAIKGKDEAAAIAATARLIRQNPLAASEIIKDQGFDPNGREARVAFEAARQIAWDAAEEAVGRMTPRQRAGLVSVEMAGSAGVNHRDEGKAYTGRDLDVQGRGNRESATAFRDHMAEVTKGWGLVAQSTDGVVNPLKINPFAALPEGERVPVTTGDLSARQNAAARQYSEQRENPEASKGEAAAAVKEYVYRTGMAREVQGASLSQQEITVQDLHEQKGWAPPQVTKSQAFGIVANEQAQFATFDKDGAKHLGRAAEALQLANPQAMTSQDRETVDLASKMNKKRDQTQALRALLDEHAQNVATAKAAGLSEPPKSSILRAYEAGLAEKRPEGDVVAEIFYRETLRGRALLEKAAQETARVKLAEFEKMQGLPGEIVTLKRAEAGRGDPGAREWIRKYDATTDAAAKAGMAKGAREAWLEESRQGLVEGLLGLKPGLKERVVAAQSQSKLMEQLNLVAEVMAGRFPALAQANEYVKNHVGVDGPVGRTLDRANGLLMTLAAAGMLVDVGNDVKLAYDRGGSRAAGLALGAVVLGGSLIKRGGIEFLAPLLLQSAALHAAEGAGLITSAGAAAAFAPLLIRDLTAMVNKAYGSWWNAYLVTPALKRALDPADPKSFCNIMSLITSSTFTPETLHADLQAFARARGLDPNKMNEVLIEALKDYLAHLRDGAMTGLQPELLKTLLALDDQSKQYLELITRLAMNDKLAELDRATADLTAKTKAANAAATPSQPPDPAGKSPEDLLKEAKADAAATAAKAKKNKKKADGEVAAATPPKVKPPPLPKKTPAPGVDQRTADKFNTLKQEGLQAAAAKAQQDELLTQTRLILNLGSDSVAPGDKMGIGVRVETPEGTSLPTDRAQMSVSRGQLDDKSVLLKNRQGIAIYTSPANYSGPVTVTVRFAGLTARRTFNVGVAAPPNAQPSLILALGRDRVGPGESASITARVEPPLELRGGRVQFSVSRGSLSKTSVALSPLSVAQAVFTAPTDYSGSVTVTASVAGLSASLMFNVGATPPPDADTDQPPAPEKPSPPATPPPDKPSPPPPEAPPAPPCPAEPIPGVGGLETNLRCFGIPQ